MRDNVHILCIQKAKKCETFLYTQKARHFAKCETLSLTIVYTKKHDSLRYVIFYENLKLAFIYKNNDTLRYMKFLNTKIWTLPKKQNKLRCVFIYKIWTLYVMRFLIEFLKMAEVGGTFIFKNQCTLR